MLAINAATITSPDAFVAAHDEVRANGYRRDRGDASRRVHQIVCTPHPAS